MNKKIFKLINERKKEVCIGILGIFILGGIGFGLSYINNNSSNKTDLNIEDNKEIASNNKEDKKENNNLEETKSNDIKNKENEENNSADKKEEAAKEETATEKVESNSSETSSNTSTNTNNSKPNTSSGSNTSSTTNKPSTSTGNSSSSNSGNTSAPSTPVVEEKPSTPVVEEKPSTPVVEETPVAPPVVEEAPSVPVVEEKPVEPVKPSFTFPMSANEILNYAVSISGQYTSQVSGMFRDTTMNTGNSGWDMPIQMVKTNSMWTSDYIKSTINQYWSDSMIMCYGDGDGWNIQVVDTGDMIEVYFLY